MTIQQPVRPWMLLDTTRGAVPIPDAACRQWRVRTAHFLVELVEVEGTVVLERNEQPDEYMVVLPPGVRAVAQTPAEHIVSDGNALLIMPPGRSTVELAGQGVVTRVFSTAATDLLSGSANAPDYVDMPAGLDPMIPWPTPRDGWRLRCYDLAEHEDATHISRVFRSTNLMVNIMRPYDAPRDPHALMPHWHDREEQVTVTVAGRFMHHLRTPWVPDSTTWREDEHLEAGSPSMLVIPARLVHTTQAMEAGCWIIDVFGPPRRDFSSKPGFVCNADDYPLPADALALA